MWVYLYRKSISPRKHEARKTTPIGGAPIVARGSDSDYIILLMQSQPICVLDLSGGQESY
eukprot:SAG11_NODE_30253_length_302_cov_1.640394_1_plen_60_part_00